jgi:hypothetical protein
MKNKNLSYLALCLMLCFTFNGVSQEMKKVDGASRTKEIVKHETQPIFTSEIDSPITSNSQFVTKGFNEEILEFTKSNSPWVLSKCEVSKSDLSANSNNYQLLLDDVKDEFNSNIFYYENEGKALLCRNDSPITPMYFGSFSILGNDIVLSHKIDGCPTCSKTVNYSRTIIKNTLVLKIQDEDEDKSDVFYVLTFIK